MPSDVSSHMGICKLSVDQYQTSIDVDRCRTLDQKACSKGKHVARAFGRATSRPNQRCRSWCDEVRA
eukprot:365328-Chlamydomonas_euryale.AAC.7